MGLADEVVEAAREMLVLDLVSGTAGNVSARVDERTFLVTPSGVPYAEVTPADLVLLDLDGAVVRGGAGRRPSSEWALHAECYRALPEAGAVAHTHPVHATMFACARKPIPVAVDEFALYAGGEVRCAAYAPSGTPDLGRNAVAALTPARSALLASHGMVTVAGTPGQAVHDAHVVERGAHVVWGSLALGGYALLGTTEEERP